MAICSKPDPVAWTNLVTIAAVRKLDFAEGIKKLLSLLVFFPAN